MPAYTVTPILEGVVETCGEGPFWEALSGTLFSVSIGDGKVHIYNAKARHHEVLQLGEEGENVSFVIPCEKGGCLAGLDRKIVHYDWEAGQLKKRTLHEVDPEEPVRFNDAKCDPNGRLVAGTMSLEKEAGVVYKPGAGSMFAMDEAGQLKKLDTGFSIGNGLGWYGSKFFYTESLDRQIFSYDWDSDGFSVSNKQVAVDFKNLPDESELGVPDGMTIDANGHLWVACFFGSRILQIDPEVGKVISEIKFPTTNITSCCFGGEGLAELYVTSSKYGAKGHQPLAGSIFKVTGLGVQGTPSVPYKGVI